jgi:hypothetical protein
VKPLEFYRLGVLTAPGAVFEPQQRTVVNRLYYGLHHEACCRYFRKFPWSQAINSNRRHTDLRIRFSSSDDPISKTVGSLLGDLMRLRTEADYRLVQPLRFRNRSMDVPQLLSLAVELAEQLLDALETYSPGEAEDGCYCPQAYRA